MKRVWRGWHLLALLLAAGCGFPEKQPPVDLESEGGPTAADFSSETTLEARYRPEVLAFHDGGEDGAFAGVGAVPIHYRHFAASPEKGAIVFLPGRTEPILKHAETFLDLSRQGYAVWALDPRGQGASGRMLPDPQVGYVEYFSDYVDDLATFITQVVRPRTSGKLFLLAHSMGAGIGAQLLARADQPFAAAALSSPMLGISTSPFPAAVAFDVAFGVCDASSAKGYALGQHPYQTESFEGNIVSHSQVRFALKVQMLEEHPELRLGGVSYRWLCQAMLSAGHTEELARLTSAPVLLLQAGADKVVLTSSEQRYCGLASRCQLEPFPDAFHELLSESDAIRNEALSRAVRFFNHFSR